MSFRELVRRIDVIDGQAMVTIAAGDEFYARLTVSAVKRLDLVEETPVFLIMKTRSFHSLLSTRLKICIHEKISVAWKPRVAARCWSL